MGGMGGVPVAMGYAGWSTISCIIKDTMSDFKKIYNLGNNDKNTTKCKPQFSYWKRL
jgi:hypothetical protein